MFEKLLASLSGGGVDYLVVGGLAVAMNGYARNTGDVDILISLSTVNVEALLQTLGAFGEGAAQELSAADFTAEEGAIRVLDAGFSVDIFTQMRGFVFADFAPTARTLKVLGQAVRFLSPEALITLKKTSLREKDRLDVAILRELIAGQRTAEPVDFGSFSPEPEVD